MKLGHIAARIFNTPLLIAEGKLDAIISGLGPRFGLDVDLPPAPAIYTTARGDRMDPGYRVVGPVGVIDIFGVLAHRSQMTADSSAILGYQTIARQLDSALSDRSVESILLNIDSPGGEVAGAFELAAQIYAARSIKPIYAVASDLALSGGFLLASAASSLAITATGAAGSVGVITKHIDVSGALAADGVKITQIFAGKHKADGHPFGPLPKEVKADLQAWVDATYTLFVDTVAMHLGVDADMIRATEARIYQGQDAIDAGLAHRIATPDQILAELSAPFQNSRFGGLSMSADEKIYSQAELDREVARVTAEKLTEGQALARTEERERIAAIHGCPEAAGRLELASFLAMQTNTSPDEAKAILAKSPQTVSAPADTGDSEFKKAMTAIGNPDVGLDAKTEDGFDTHMANVGSVLRQIGMHRDS
jgi:capsid assembly protease